MQELPERLVFGLDIGTRSLVGTVGAREDEHQFKVFAIDQVEHDTRAMLDGQIHDIPKVSASIRKMKKRLESKLGRELTEVSIAAAGRVLKTVNVSPFIEFTEETVIHDDEIHTLEMLGVEEAYKTIRAAEDNGNDFYCVGYSVMHYYINGQQMTNLEEHKGTRIDAELIATFLPQDVVDDLYAAVENAGLNVANLTLEPIAAIDVAIPEKFRLLNIALVDVGAGTSDICITNDGCVIAYGMIPHAGDEITEIIARLCLVDFNTAEQIKRDLTENDKVEFKDIMDITQTMKADDILKTIAPTLNSITEEIAEKIKELNGGKSVSAVFVVGGGGKVKGFTEHIAEVLGLQNDRVALRGKEVLGEVEFADESIVKDPLLVTPIGICYSYYEARNNFIYVTLNGNRIKLYDNNRLTIYDVLSRDGFSNDDLFPKRGKSIHYTLDGSRRSERGEVGEPAEIRLNGNIVSISKPISKNDIITIKPSTEGSPAKLLVSKIREMDSSFNIIFNGKELSCPKLAEVNGKLVSGFYEIADGDDVVIRNFYTLQQIMEMLDLPYHSGIMVNNMAANENTKIYANFTVTDNASYTEDEVEQEMAYSSYDELPDDYIEEEPVIDINFVPEPSYTETADAITFGTGEDAISIPIAAPEKTDLPQPETNIAKPVDTFSLGSGMAVMEAPFEKLEDDSNQTNEFEQESKQISNPSAKDVTVKVNDTWVTLKGKIHYLLVDVLDFYPFDMSEYRGRLILEINGVSDMDFTSPVHDGDQIRIAWSE
ncbi:MAG: cell division protein FtsA [Catonella sp.]|uniref:cell division protein FtsA n=1 Tax=Catonella sp. TaxID=2382125 RepID=UPI003F9F898E